MSIVFYFIMSQVFSIFVSYLQNCASTLKTDNKNGYQTG